MKPSRALSLILCITAALILAFILVQLLMLGVHRVTQTPNSNDIVGAQVLEPPEPPEPQVRKPVIKQTDQTDNPK